MSTASFFLQALMDFKKIASFTPSSQALCAGLTTSIQQSPSKLNVLEAGSGTGVIAKYMLVHSLPLAQLDVVESNPKLFRLLDKSVLLNEQHGDLTLNKSLNDVVSFLADIENRYHLIISSIPLNSLSSEAVLKILEAYKRSLKQQGELCFYEYIGSRFANRTHAFFTQETRFEQILKSVFIECDVSEVVCLKNFPPARIVRVRLSS